MDVFETCHEINDLLLAKKQNEARCEVIRLLDYMKENQIAHTPLVNNLIRQTGLFPYIDFQTANWDDQVVFELFKVDVGYDTPLTLHREQSKLLKRLIEGDNIAVSAPTSFGKSFVIDAFISIMNPSIVVIIVPTIALTDETRRRVYRKFGDTYKIITTSEVDLEEKNILIFPQERAINYVKQLDSVDLLIIDEFYKAGGAFDSERSPALVKAMLKLGAKAKQKYYLAPNISSLKQNAITADMDFEKLEFNTVFLEKHDYSNTISGEEEKKEELLRILAEKNTKSLIYAGTYKEIKTLSEFFVENSQKLEAELLSTFSAWLRKNYRDSWILADLVERGVGIHNGRLHRSLSQIQVKLFEEREGLNNMVSTSSIIEGVNTSAENVILWRNKIGQRNLNDFTYKNIIGRGGRMFQHFIGKIYILEPPPQEDTTQLDIDFPDQLVGDFDEQEIGDKISNEQKAKIIAYKEEMSEILGAEVFSRLQRENSFHTSDSDLIKNIALDMLNNPNEWNGLAYLNSNIVSQWERFLYKAINLKRGGWDIAYGKFVAFVKALSQNWSKSIPEILNDLRNQGISIAEFFQLERNVTFKLSALMHDINILQREIFEGQQGDISPFVSQLSHAFLPSIVYQLEEYGLPRMISKQIHNSGIVNFQTEDLTIHRAIEKFQDIKLEGIIESVQTLDDFDIYILEYFYEGITINKRFLN